MMEHEDRQNQLAPALARALGVRRSVRLRVLIRATGLPAESLLDLGIELVDLASRKLAPPAVRRTAVGLGAARWRNVGPKERTELLRRVVQTRWAKSRQRRKRKGRPDEERWFG